MRSIPIIRRVTMLLVITLSGHAAATTAELFSPMPLAAHHDATDSSLVAIHKDPSRTLLQRVDAHPERLNETTVSIDIALEPGHIATAAHTGGYTTSDGTIVWYGEWDDRDDWRRATDPDDDARRMNRLLNQVTLVNHAGMITGSARMDGKLFAIQPLISGGHAIVAVDERRLPPDHIGEPPVMPFSATKAVAPAADRDARVLVYFSEDAFIATADHWGVSQLAVAETNRGLSDGNVGHRLQLAFSIPHEYRDSGDLLTDLRRLTSADDDYLKVVHRDRDQEAADLVVLIVENGDVCGYGWTNGSAEYAFSVVKRSCATGYYSFGHEIGHNYGATHDPSDSHNPDYPYGHGFQDREARLRTIMATDCPSGCTRVNAWSSPSTLVNGRTMGNATESDNRRVLIERATTVAGFR